MINYLGIILKLNTIKIDSEISLRLTAILEDPVSNLVFEPEDCSSGLGGVSNNSSEGGWEHAGMDAPEPKDRFGSDIWNN
jgi:hypothetical protein